jgi:hypothetical protein
MQWSLRHLFRTLRGRAAARAARRPATTTRPQVEALEERAVPTTNLGMGQQALARAPVPQAAVDAHSRPLGAVSTAVATYSYSAADRLDERLWLRPGLHPPGPCHVVGSCEAAGGLSQNLAARGTPGPSADPSEMPLSGTALLPGDSAERLIPGTPPSRVSDVFALVDRWHAGGVPQRVHFNLATPVALGPQGYHISTAPTFSWTAVAGATHYALRIADVNTGVLIVVPDVLGTSWTPGVLQRLASGDTFVWSVQALDDFGDASGVSILAFVTA